VGGGIKKYKVKEARCSRRKGFRVRTENWIKEYNMRDLPGVYFIEF